MGRNRKTPSQIKADREYAKWVNSISGNYINNRVRPNENKIENQNNFIAEIIDVVIESKDYNLDILRRVIKDVSAIRQALLDENTKDKKNLIKKRVSEEDADVIRKYRTIIFKYKKLELANNKLNLINMVEAALKHSYDIVNWTFNYPIKTPEEKWNRFTEERKSKLKPITEDNIIEGDSK